MTHRTWQYPSIAVITSATFQAYILCMSCQAQCPSVALETGYRAGSTIAPKLATETSMRHSYICMHWSSHHQSWPPLTRAASTSHCHSHDHSTTARIPLRGYVARTTVVDTSALTTRSSPLAAPVPFPVEWDRDSIDLIASRRLMLVK